MDTTVPRRRRLTSFRKVGWLAVGAMTATALLATPGIASAHTPSASLTCVNSVPTLKVDLTLYVATYTNSVTITIDGSPDATDSSASFGASYHLSKAVPPATSPHTAKVVVVAGDYPNNATYSPTYNLSVDACQKSSPTLGTVPSSGGLIGTVLNDTATLTGANSPTGSITFNLYGPTDTSCTSTALYSQTVTLSPDPPNFLELTAR